MITLFVVWSTDYFFGWLVGYFICLGDELVCLLPGQVVLV